MVGPCVVCCSSRPPADVISEFKANRLGEEEAVTFFLRKFLKYPLLGDEELPGGKSNFVSFCWSCLPVIQEAQSLYKIIAELEEKMSILRKRVERRVVLSFHTESNRRNSEESKRSVFNAVRSKIYMRNADNFKQDLESGGGGVVVGGGEVLIPKTAFRQNSDYSGSGGGPGQPVQVQQRQLGPGGGQVTSAWPVVDPLAFLQMAGHPSGGEQVGCGEHEQQQTFTVPMAGMAGGGSGPTQYFPVVSVATIAANSDGNSAWDGSGAGGGGGPASQQQQTIQIPSASHTRTSGGGGRSGGFSQDSGAGASASSRGNQKSRKSQSGKSSSGLGLRRAAANISAPCTACGNSFSRKDSLARHQKLYCIKIPSSKAYQKMSKPKLDDDVGLGNSLNDKSVVFKTDGDTSYTSEEDLLYPGTDQESVPNY